MFYNIFQKKTSPDSILSIISIRGEYLFGFLFLIQIRTERYKEK